MTNKEFNEELDYLFEIHIQMGERLDKMISGECMKNCKAYEETNGASCIECSDYWEF